MLVRHSGSPTAPADGLPVFDGEGKIRLYRERRFGNRRPALIVAQRQRRSLDDAHGAVRGPASFLIRTSQRRWSAARRKVCHTVNSASGYFLRKENEHTRRGGFGFGHLDGAVALQIGKPLVAQFIDQNQAADARLHGIGRAQRAGPMGTFGGLVAVVLAADLVDEALDRAGPRADRDFEFWRCRQSRGHLLFSTWAWPCRRHRRQHWPRAAPATMLPVHAMPWRPRPCA